MPERTYSACAAGLAGLLILGKLVPVLPGTSLLLDKLPVNPFPFYWIGVILIALVLFPQVHSPGRLRSREQFRSTALAGSAIFLALRFGVGFLLQDIAATPYDLSPLGIIRNFFVFFPPLIARELIRAHTIATACRKKHSVGWIVGITVGFCLVGINFTKLSVLQSGKDWGAYLAGEFLPLVADNCLAAGLVFCGGAAASLTYFGSLSAFQYLFPFLPSLPWIGDCALGTLVPVFLLLAVLEQHRILSNGQPTRSQEPMGPFIAALVLSVAFAWFVSGVFPIYPSVVLTGSMEPLIQPGDAVLIRKFSSEDEIYHLSKNDIINFKREDISITHRIVAVLYDESGNVSFQTKGDNNQSPDDIIVQPQDLNGIVENVVPKVGLPVLWLKQNEPVPEGVTDH